MKAALIVDSHLPGNIKITGETDAEDVLLRSLYQYGVDHPDCRFGVLNHGGVDHYRQQSMLLGYHMPAPPTEPALSDKPAHTIVVDVSVRERLAEFAHTVWSEWIEYMFHNMNYENLCRWWRQAGTPYLKLSDTEKASDWKIADRWIEMVLKEIKNEAH